jgi:hypothetical protein
MNGLVQITPLPGGRYLLEIRDANGRSFTIVLSQECMKELFHESGKVQQKDPEHLG